VASTVRVTERTDDDLETLAARLYLKTHVKVTKQDLLELLVKRGLQSEDALAAHLQGTAPREAKEAWKRVLGESSDWGVRTRAEDIDRDVYGRES